MTPRSLEEQVPLASLRHLSCPRRFLPAGPSARWPTTSSPRAASSPVRRRCIQHPPRCRQAALCPCRLRPKTWLCLSSFGGRSDEADWLLRRVLPPVMCRRQDCTGGGAGGGDSQGRHEGHGALIRMPTSTRCSLKHACVGSKDFQLLLRSPELTWGAGDRACCSPPPSSWPSAAPSTPPAWTPRRWP